MGWLEEQNHNLNESSKLHGSAVLTDGSTAQESVKVWTAVHPLRDS